MNVKRLRIWVAATLVLAGVLRTTVVVSDDARGSRRPSSYRARSTPGSSSSALSTKSRQSENLQAPQQGSAGAIQLPGTVFPLPGVPPASATMPLLPTPSPVPSPAVPGAYGLAPGTGTGSGLVGGAGTNVAPSSPYPAYPGSPFGYVGQNNYLPVPPTAYRALAGSGASAWGQPVQGFAGQAGGVYPNYNASAPTVPTIGAVTPQAPTALAGKPFANYTPPPVYSPYMNLFRTDNDRGRISNYYNLVRPIVEQGNINSQTQANLQSLQDTTRTQGSQLQQLDQRTRPTPSLPGFMDFRQYYPGLSR